MVKITFFLGEASVNAAWDYLEATCLASTERADHLCGNALKPGSDAWMPQDTDTNIWINVKFT